MLCTQLSASMHAAASALSAPLAGALASHPDTSAHVRDTYSVIRSTARPFRRARVARATKAADFETPHQSALYGGSITADFVIDIAAESPPMSALALPSMATLEVVAIAAPVSTETSTAVAVSSSLSSTLNESTAAPTIVVVAALAVETSSLSPLASSIEAEASSATVVDISSTASSSSASSSTASSSTASSSAPVHTASPLITVALIRAPVAAGTRAATVKRATGTFGRAVRFPAHKIASTMAVRATRTRGARPNTRTSTRTHARTVAKVLRASPPAVQARPRSPILAFGSTCDRFVRA